MPTIQYWQAERDWQICKKIKTIWGFIHNMINIKLFKKTNCNKNENVFGREESEIQSICTKYISCKLYWQFSVAGFRFSTLPYLVQWIFLLCWLSPFPLFVYFCFLSVWLAFLLCTIFFLLNIMDVYRCQCTDRLIAKIIFPVGKKQKHKAPDILKWRLCCAWNIKC